MPSIAIVGTSGAGKTVFVTCLAQYVQQGDRGVILHPQNVHTQIYIQNGWAELQAGDWPPSTLPGDLPSLDWHLTLPNCDIFTLLKCPPLDIRMFDPPGQDILTLMANGASLTEIPAHLAPLASSIVSADIVVLLVNLADVLGAPNDTHRIVSELVIKFVLDVIDRRNGPKETALVFTQADQYPDFLGASVALTAVARDYLPLVHQTLTTRQWCQLFAVAAVSHTTIIVENGTARKVPAPGFQSHGFDPLLIWIKARATELYYREIWKRIAPWVFSAVGIVVVLVVWFNWPKRPEPPKPAGRIVSSAAKYEYVGVFNYDVIVSGTVSNTGGVGLVTVRAYLNLGTEHWQRSSQIRVPAGGSSPFEFRFSEYSMGEPTFSVTVD